MQRAYLAGTLDVDDLALENTHGTMVSLMDRIGCTEQVEQMHLLAALEALRGFGVQGPKESPSPKPDGESEPATAAQWTFVRKLADERQAVAPDGPLTKEQASRVITELKAGTYDADAWTVPF